MLLNSDFHMRKNVSENYPEFGHAPSKRLASPRRLKEFKDCLFYGPLNINLPWTPAATGIQSLSGDFEKQINGCPCGRPTRSLVTTLKGRFANNIIPSCTRICGPFPTFYSATFHIANSSLGMDNRHVITTVRQSTTTYIHNGPR